MATIELSEQAGGGGDGYEPNNNPNLNHLGSFANYTALVTAHPTSTVGYVASVQDSEGTAWLPTTFGGTYHPEGTYVWNGTIWDSDTDDFANKLHTLDSRVLDSLGDVTQGFTSSAGTVTDDGKMIHFDFATKQFITTDSVTHGTVVLNCKTSVATSTIAKGLPVYIDSFDSDLHVVELADADGAGTHPCIGFTATELNDTDTKHVITFGKLTGLDTTSTVSTLNPNGETWAVGEALWLSKTAGGLTNVRPTGVTEIQRIAKILKVHASGGQIFIFNTGRTAGLPNLSENKTWIGDTNAKPIEATLPTRIEYVEANEAITDNATGTWLERTLSTAPANTAVDIMMRSDTGSNVNAGVRAVGSTRPLTWKQDTDRQIMITVMTNADSKIEIYGDSTTLDFTYIGHSVIV